MHAEGIDWKPHAVLVAGQMFDLVSTLRFLHNGSGCTKATAFYGPHPTAVRLVATKAMFTGGSLVLLRYAEQSHNIAARRISKGFAYFAGSFGATSGIRNVVHCGW